MCRGFLLSHAECGLRSGASRGGSRDWSGPEPSGTSASRWVGCGALGSIGPGTLLGVLIKAKEDQPTGVQPVNQAELMLAGVCSGRIWGCPRQTDLIPKLPGIAGVIVRGTSLQSAPSASLGPLGNPYCGCVLCWSCGQHAVPAHSIQSRGSQPHTTSSPFPPVRGQGCRKRSLRRASQALGLRDKPRNISVKRRFHI